MSSRTESMPQSDQIAALAQLGERDYRALTETMTVLDDCARAPANADRLYHVTTGSGASYVVEPELGACECPDAQYRDAICKHILRVRYETGQVSLPDGINEAALDDQFRQFVTPTETDDTQEDPQ